MRRQATQKSVTALNQTSEKKGNISTSILHSQTVVNLTKSKSENNIKNSPMMIEKTESKHLIG